MVKEIVEDGWNENIKNKKKDWEKKKEKPNEIDIIDPLDKTLNSFIDFSKIILYIRIFRSCNGDNFGLKKGSDIRDRKRLFFAFRQKQVPSPQSSCP